MDYYYKEQVSKLVDVILSYNFDSLTFICILSFG